MDCSSASTNLKINCIVSVNNVQHLNWVNSLIQLLLCRHLFINGINHRAQGWPNCCGVSFNYEPWVSWHSQKVWNAHETTSPNWHLASSAHHWSADFLFPAEIANGAGNSQHKAFVVTNLEAKSAAIDRWVRFLKHNRNKLKEFCQRC